MQIVATDEVAIGELGGERQKFLPELGIAAINDRRSQPFDDDRISLEQQLECLSEFPAVDVEIVDKRCLDHIALLPGRQVLIDRTTNNKRQS